MARKSEMMDAIEALAKAKDISVDQIVSAVEEGCKAAYRRFIKRGQNAPLNLSVVLSREHDVQIFARKVVAEEVEDDSQQISLEQAKALIKRPRPGRPYSQQKANRLRQRLQNDGITVK